MQPITPPRAKTSSSQKPAALLYTPHTPFLKHAPSPQKVAKPQQQFSPVKLAKPSSSHLSTPKPTPRHRKKNSVSSAALLGDAFNFHSTTRTLFPPTPSTIGSGRTKDVIFKSPLKQRVDDSPIRFQRCGVLESPEETFAISKRKLTFNVESDEDMENELAQPTTPQKKVVTRELAQQWVDDIPEDIEDCETLIKKKDLVNPFISSNHDTKEFILKRPSKPLQYVEYVNKKGDKIVKKAGSLDNNLDDDIALGHMGEKKTLNPKNLFEDLKKQSPFKVFQDDNNN